MLQNSLFSELFKKGQRFSSGILVSILELLKIQSISLKIHRKNLPMTSKATRKINICALQTDKWKSKALRSSHQNIYMRTEGST